MPAYDRNRESTDDLEVLLRALPPEIVEAVHRLPERADLIEVVLDLGRRPEARFPASEEMLLDREVTDADIAYVVDHIGSFGDDNRAGIERTLHRISAIRNRNGKIVGLTCRIGRAVYGTIEIIEDFVETAKSILIMGRPGIGKTTMLREAARVLADDFGKRVVVVDTSNEIAGDGDIPHPAIGKARRMQVRTPSLQHEVMIEAVENHMPEVIVIDEIGTELEAQAARTIAERGVQLIGTAHGNNLDNLMLNPTLSDLIGGIQSVTLGDEEARRRRTQKSVLERKAPPTFDVVVEIQDRERVTVHTDVAETIDALLRGDPIAPELRWRDQEGVHRSQSRPKPSPREQLPAERFAGLVGAGSSWRMEPGWRGEGSYRGGYRENAPGPFRSGYRPGATGGWRQTRGSSRESGVRGSNDQGPAQAGGYPPLRTLPGERFAGPGGAGGIGPESGSERGAAGTWSEGSPFVAGGLADRGPLEREPGAPGSAPAAPEPRARDARELQRQRAWREQAGRALNALRADEGTAPINADDLTADDESLADRARDSSLADRARDPSLADRAIAGLPLAGDAAPALRRQLGEDQDPAGDASDDEFDDDEAEEGEFSGDGGSVGPDGDWEGDRGGLRVQPGIVLPTLRVLPIGISRKRLEQSIRELQLPVIIARDPDDADVVMTLKNEYRQKTPMLREAEDRAMPIYVLKSNTVLQMQASLTSIFSLEVDPREAALRETEEAIGLVLHGSDPIELSPQNAYIRRLQHQMAERANLVSRSRGREPYRRVRLYPDQARSSWR